MQRLKCDLIVNSNARHLQPILSGFNMLQRNKLISLKQNFPRDTFLLRGKKILVDKLYVNEMHLDVIINNSILVHYDVADSKKINEDALSACDIYFKRSYCTDYISSYYPEDAKKIKPLGLYFLAIDNELDLYSLKRDIRFSSGINKLKSIVKHFDRTNTLTDSPYLKFFEQTPLASKAPKILFFAKVWDPDFDGEYKITTEDHEDRIQINQHRVDCIRALKEAYGEKFTGGIEASNFSRKYCRDLVITNTEKTKRRNYIKLMQEHDICIATAGLHQSVGGKFTEYLAASRSIVTEPLAYDPIGSIKAEVNYFEFTKVEECVSAVDVLMNNTMLREKQMLNNYEYYHSVVRPDLQVKTSLITALKKV